MAVSHRSTQECTHVHVTVSSSVMRVRCVLWCGVVGLAQSDVALLLPLSLSLSSSFMLSRSPGCIDSKKSCLLNTESLVLTSLTDNSSFILLSISDLLLTDKAQRRPLCSTSKCPPWPASCHQIRVYRTDRRATVSRRALEKPHNATLCQRGSDTRRQYDCLMYSVYQCSQSSKVR